MMKNWPSINRALAAALAAGILSACSNIPRLPSGTWEMQYGEGKTMNVDVSQLHDTEYYFRAPNAPIAGFYTVNEALEVRMTKPDTAAMTGTIWHVESDGVLKLIAQPPPEASGMQLLGAMLIKNP